MSNPTPMEMLQSELNHWKQVVEELEQKVENMEKNEYSLVTIAKEWEAIAERYKRDSDFWEHTAIKKERRIEELLAEIEELDHQQE